MNIKNKLTSIFLVFTMMLSLSVNMTYATSDAVLYESQLDFTTMGTVDEVGYSWDAASKTLTINECGIIMDMSDNSSSAIIVPDGTTIVMNGDIIITGESSYGGDVHGIFSTGSFSIEGTGNIEIDYGTHAIYSFGSITVNLTGDIILTTNNDGFYASTGITLEVIGDVIINVERYSGIYTAATGATVYIDIDGDLIVNSVGNGIASRGTLNVTTTGDCLISTTDGYGIIASSDVSFDVGGDMTLACFSYGYSSSANNTFDVEGDLLLSGIAIADTFSISCQNLEIANVQTTLDTSDTFTSFTNNGVIEISDLSILDIIDVSGDGYFLCDSKYYDTDGNQVSNVSTGIKIYSSTDDFEEDGYKWVKDTKTLTITDDLLVISNSSSAISLPTGSTILLKADLEIISYRNYSSAINVSGSLTIKTEDTDEIYDLSILSNYDGIHCDGSLSIGSEDALANISLEIDALSSCIYSTGDIYINVSVDINFNSISDSSIDTLYYMDDHYEMSHTEGFNNVTIISDGDISVTSTKNNGIVGSNIELEGNSLSINAGNIGIYASEDVSLTSNNTVITSGSEDIYLADDEHNITINGILILPNNDNTVEENEEMIASYGFLGDGIVIVNGYKFTTAGVAFTHSILIEDNDNGSIMVEGDVIENSIDVYEGDDLTITISPNTGYQVSKVYIDEELVLLEDNTYTFENILDNHTVEVIYEKITYTLSVSQEGEGTILISYTNGNTIEYGDNVTLSFEPSEGYEITSVSIDDEDFGTISEYCFEDIDDNHTVKVIFSEVIVQQDDSDDLDDTQNNNDTDDTVTDDFTNNEDDTNIESEEDLETEQDSNLEEGTFDTTDTSDSSYVTFYVMLMIISSLALVVFKKQKEIKL